MIPHRPLGRLLCAASVAFVSIAACAGGAPAVGAPAVGAAQSWTSIPDADDVARRDPAEKAPADAGADAAPRCPYGSLEDPHRGFVRCLLPDERDAGWTPPPPPDTPPEVIETLTALPVFR